MILTPLLIKVCYIALCFNAFAVTLPTLELTIFALKSKFATFESYVLSVESLNGPKIGLNFSYFLGELTVLIHLIRILNRAKIS